MMTRNEMPATLVKGWRVGEWSAPRGVSALDILAYEEQELGNYLGVSDSARASLVGKPGSNLLWVTTRKADALHYGSHPYKVTFRSAAQVIGSDGDGGYLVLIEEEPTV